MLGGRPVVLGVLFFTVALALRGLMAEWARRHGWLVTTTTASVTTTTTFRYANGVLAEEAVAGTPIRRYVTDASGSITCAA
jgi:hypothetical protein